MLLLISLILPAMAGDDPVRCTTTLTLPDSEPLEIPGWGSSEEEARGAAWRAARLTAELHQVPVLWAPVFGWGADTEGAMHLLVEAEVGELGVPGATVTPGGCAPWPLEDRGKGGWSSTWGGGPEVWRFEPAAAAEASRRLACTQLWVEPLRQGFEAAARVEPEAKDEAMFAATRKGWPAVAACMTGQPELEALPGKVRGPAAGQYACTVWTPADPGEWDSLQAWGGTAEEAAEAAWQEATVARLREGLAMALEARSSAAPEMKMTLVAAGFERAMALFPGHDPVEQAATTCQALEGEEWSLRWVPADGEEVDLCGLEEEGVLSHLSTGFSPEPSRQRLCDQSRQMVDLTRSAHGRASPEMAELLLVNGWSMVFGCQADCARHTSLQDTSGERVALHFSPDLSTRVSAEAVLAAAAATRDLGRLQVVLPLERRMLDRIAGDEEFWAAMADPSMREQILVWSEAPGGRWMLAPRPR